MFKEARYSFFGARRLGSNLPAGLLKSCKDKQTWPPLLCRNYFYIGLVSYVLHLYVGWLHVLLTSLIVCQRNEKLQRSYVTKTYVNQTSTTIAIFGAIFPYRGWYWEHCIFRPIHPLRTVLGRMKTAKVHRVLVKRNTCTCLPQGGDV